MKRTIAGAVAVLAVLALALPARGAETYWDHDPATPGDWFDPTNWSSGIPDDSTPALIDNGGTVRIDAGDAIASPLTVGYENSGTMVQTGGSLSAWDSFHIGSQQGSTGSYYLYGGKITTGFLLGRYGDGYFYQSGGSILVSPNSSQGEIRLGDNDYVQGFGHFELSGNGEIHIGSIRVGWEGLTEGWGTPPVGGGGIGEFLQEGNSVVELYGSLRIGGDADVVGSSGRYELVSGTLGCANGEEIGFWGPGKFVQTGGSHSTGNLSIGTYGTYEYAGGSLSIQKWAASGGVFDFCDTGTTLTIGAEAYINFGGGQLLRGENASIKAGTESLVIVPAGFNVETDLASYLTGGVMHEAGKTLVVPAGRGFVGLNNVFMKDHVQCAGTIRTRTGEGYYLNNGLEITGSGSVDLGDGYLTVNDAISGMSGGSLKACIMYVGENGEGHFTQTGGSCTASSLYLGSRASDRGNYELSGSGSLNCEYESVGLEGSGEFIQSGGSNRATQLVNVGVSSGESGTYRLRGGELSTKSLRLGLSGANGLFLQSGGACNLTTSLVVGNKEGSNCRYELSGEGQLTAGYEYIGSSGTGILEQTSGSNTVNYSLILGSESTGTGTFNLSGTGVLTAQDASIGNRGTGTVNHSAGSASFSGTVDVGQYSTGQGTYNLSGTGDLAFYRMFIGGSGAGRLVQTGGILDAKHILVQTSGVYDYSGGTMQLTRRFGNAGTVDCHSQSVTVEAPSGFIDLRGGNYVNTENATLNAGANTLVLVGTGRAPEMLFGTANVSGLTHQAGSTLVIPAGRSIIGWVNLSDRVECEGSLSDGGDGAIHLFNGIWIGTAGEARLGTGSLTVKDTGSGMEGGTLETMSMDVSGVFTQSGGSNTEGDWLRVGSDGRYVMSGGTLKTSTLVVGWAKGTGRFDITDPSAQVRVSYKMTVEEGGTVTALPGSVIHLGSLGGFENHSTSESALSDLTNIEFQCGSAKWSTHLFELGGVDMGRDLDGFVDNFAIGAIRLEEDADMMLVENFDNGNRGGVGGSREAMYLDELTMLPGSTLDLYGKHLYVRDLNFQGGTIVTGTDGALISLCPGDADNNFTVDGADLAIWRQNYDPTKKNANSFAMGDWNNDGYVDGADLALWQQNYSPIGGVPENTPEPGTLLLLGTGALGLAGMMRRRIMN